MTQQPRSSKRVKTTHGGPHTTQSDGSMVLTPLEDYRYSPSNVFARMQSSDMLSRMELLFNRPHTFAMLERSVHHKVHLLTTRFTLTTRLRIRVELQILVRLHGTAMLW